MKPILVQLLALMVFSPLFAAFTESPDLHQQVAAGTLPAIEKRLPMAPLVVSPVEKPGHYGGTWHMVLVGLDSTSTLCRVLGYEHLVRWDQNWTRVVPNLASNWTINADATVYRFQLRQGLRWSDGVPFTAHDIVAWMDDIVRDPELTPIPMGWLVADGKLPDCTAPDDYTLEFKFTAPNALFLEQLAGMRANEMTRYPAHYFRKFHRRHNPDGAAALMKSTGLPWPAAFFTVSTPMMWRNADTPTLDAWCLVNPYIAGTTSVLAVRNPYYWKVDTLGRQLPYIDKIQFDVVANDREALQRVLAGQVDFQRHDFAQTSPSAAQEIQSAVKDGRLATVRVVPIRANVLAVCLNLTHPDPAMRSMLGNKRVRIALSEAINRQALNQTLYQGEGTPWQLAPRPMSPFFNRRLGEQYTAYSPERSRQTLEEAGLRATTPEGMRTMPDGRPFKIKIIVRSPGSPIWATILDQIKQDWAAVGVRMEWTLVQQNQYYDTIIQNQQDGAVFNGIGGYTPVLEPDFVLPVSFEPGQNISYANPWARWFVNPKAPGTEKPPASVEKQMNLFRRVIAEPDPKIRTRLMAQVLDLAADEFYVIGILTEPPRFEIRTPGFRNVPASHFDSWLYPDPGPFNPCQFYLEPVPPSTK